MNKQLYYINSLNRQSGTNSNFQYKIQLPSDANFTHCSVIQASIPKSYYLVQDGQNTFTLKENTNEFTITIPIGNYSRTSFVSKLATLLNASGAFTYTVTVPNPNNGEPETGKITYSVSGNSGVQPQFIFTTYVYEILGFDINSTNTFVGDTITSTNVINLQKENTIFIHSDMVTNQDDNILQDIFTSNTSDYGNIIYNNHDLNLNSKKISTLDNTYHFYLTDENGQEINLNGRNFQMTLLLYKLDDTNELIKRYIKYKVTK